MSGMNNILGRLRKPRSGETFQQVLTADFISALVESIQGLAKGDNIITGSGCNIRKDNSSGMLKLTASATATSARAATVDPLPWDIYSLDGEGDPDPKTGKYSSYKAKVYPGTLNGLIPTNLTGDNGLNEFTISGTVTIIFKVRAATNGSNITSLTIVADETQPIPQVPAVNAMPAAFDAVFAMVIDGQVFRTIGAGNISATSTKLFITDKATTPEFGQLGYESRYIWGISS